MIRTSSRCRTNRPTADRWLDAGFHQACRVSDREVLRTAVTVAHQAIEVSRPVVHRLLERELIGPGRREVARRDVGWPHGRKRRDRVGAS